MDIGDEKIQDEDGDVRGHNRLRGRATHPFGATACPVAFKAANRRENKAKQSGFLHAHKEILGIDDPLQFGEKIGDIDLIKSHTNHKRSYDTGKNHQNADQGHRQHAGQDAGGHQIRKRIHRHHAHGIDLLIDLHGCNFRSHGRTGPSRDEEGSNHRRQLASEGKAGRGSYERFCAKNGENFAQLKAENTADHDTGHEGDHKTATANEFQLGKEQLAINRRMHHAQKGLHDEEGIISDQSDCLGDDSADESGCRYNRHEFNSLRFSDMGDRACARFLEFQQAGIGFVRLCDYNARKAPKTWRSSVKIFGVLWCLCLAFVSQTVRATCASLVRGQITVDIQSCSNVPPEQAFGSHEPKYNFIRDLPPAQRKAFLDSYRGLSVRAKVAYSLAVRSGLSPEQGALSGETITAYIPPQILSCTQVHGKRIQAIADEVCCEGGGEAPCLLGSSVVLKKAKVIGSAHSKAGNNDARNAARPDYRQALKLLGQRDYKGATALLEKLRAAKQLDVQGSYLLAAAYRDMDKCPAAVPLLEGIYQRFERSDFWSDDETYIRRGTLLYARCLAMMERSGESVMILQSFLVEPKKFSKEINESFNHPDFGYIRTSKAFLDYRDTATRALAKPQ